MLAAAAIAAILHSTEFAALRQGMAEAMLGHLATQPIGIDGPVELNLLDGPSLQMGRLVIRHGGAVPDSGHSIRSMRLTFSWPSILGGDFRAADVHIAGLRIDASPVPDGSATPADVGRLMASLSRTLIRTTESRHLTWHDVEIARTSDPNGWNGSASLKHLELRLFEDGQELRIAGQGALNDTPLLFDARLVTPERGSGPFDVKVRLPGLSGTASGTLRHGDASGGFEATVGVDVASIGDVLDLLRLHRVEAGSARISARLRGERNRISAPSLSLEAHGPPGHRVSVSGSVRDLATMRGLDLPFVATFADRPEEAADGPTAAMALRRIRGRMTGSAAALRLEDLMVTTGIATAALGEIGPVEVGRVARDEQGRLSLLDIRIRDGSEATPNLDLKAQVSDALRLTGVDVAGSFDYPIVDLLGTSAQGRGRLEGLVELSDRSGTLVLERFAARTVDAGQIALTLSLTEPDTGRREATAMAVTLDVPDFAAFAAAYGLPSSGMDRFVFAGLVTRGSGRWHADGTATVGASDIHLALDADILRARPVVRGRMRATVLHLDDLRHGRDLAGVARFFSPDALDVDDAYADRILVSLDVEATDIAGIGSLRAGLTYERGLLSLEPARIGFMDGSVTGSVRVDTQAEPPSVRVAGTLGRIELGALLRRLDIDPSISGVLDGQVDLRFAGADIARALGSIDGRIDVTIRDGTIASRAIDLTGRSLLNWLFTAAPAGNGIDLTCFAGGAVLRSGRGSVEHLVLETRRVRIVGAGTLDLGEGMVEIDFTPQARQPELVGVATPFRIAGPLRRPVVAVGPADIAGRVVMEMAAAPFDVLTAPLRVLGDLFSGGPPENRSPSTCAPAPANR